MITVLTFRLNHIVVSNFQSLRNCGRIIEDLNPWISITLKSIAWLIYWQILSYKKNTYCLIWIRYDPSGTSTVLSAGQTTYQQHCEHTFLVFVTVHFLLSLISWHEFRQIYNKLQSHAPMLLFAKDTTSNLKHIIGPNCHGFWLNSLRVWQDILWITTGGKKAHR